MKYSNKNEAYIIIDSVPGDKSISHRAFMLSAIAEGSTYISGISICRDCLSTINCLQSMGIKIDIDISKKTAVVHGKGLYGLSKPENVLDCQNSATTMRLLSGILIAMPFDSVLSGDSSLKKRPMKRIIEPLKLMNGGIYSLNHDYAPLYIKGGKLNGIKYFSNISSAQVKSAILFAGLYAGNTTTVLEPELSRNHSELMLKDFGAGISTDYFKDTSYNFHISTTISNTDKLYSHDIHIPGDISSAAYFMAAALIIPEMHVLIRNVGINPTRTGIIKVFKQMGAYVNIYPAENSGSEPYADIEIKSSQLHGIVIEGSIIPTLIDELPVICAVSCFAQGTTIIKDAAELKVKESDRIAVMCSELSKLGADITETCDGMIINGKKTLRPSKINSYYDHRIAMTFAVLNAAIGGGINIKGSECADISYPGFYNELKKVCQKSY